MNTSTLTSFVSIQVASWPWLIVIIISHFYSSLSSTTSSVISVLLYLHSRHTFLPIFCSPVCYYHLYYYFWLNRASFLQFWEEWVGGGAWGLGYQEFHPVLLHMPGNTTDCKSLRPSSKVDGLRKKFISSINLWCSLERENQAEIVASIPDYSQ